MHSTYLCNKCYFEIRNIKKRQSASSIQKTRDTFHSHEDKRCSFNPAFKPNQRTSCRHREETSSVCLRRRSLCHQPTILPKAKPTDSTYTTPLIAPEMREREESEDMFVPTADPSSTPIDTLNTTDLYHTEIMSNTSQQYMQEADSSSSFFNESHLQSTSSSSLTIIDQLQQLTQRLIPDNSIQNNSNAQGITDTSEAASHINPQKSRDATQLS